MTEDEFREASRRYERVYRFTKALEHEASLEAHNAISFIACTIPESDRTELYHVVRQWLARRLDKAKEDFNNT